MTSEFLSSSFRDPSGFVFRHEGEIYRQVNQRYREHFDRLTGSGLYEALVKERLLVPHEEVSLSLARTPEAYKILKPAQIPFICYPYEWSFSQFQDAALATLRVHKAAFEKGMVLKDASAYNIQFYQGRATFIDTLSFETYREGAPWVAYRQYCQHFLGPLALMAYRDVRLAQLLRHNIDGIPLDLVSSLLPAKTRLKGALLMHLHLHAKSQARHQDNPSGGKAARVSRAGLQGIIESLESATAALALKSNTGVWSDYYSDTNYSETAAAHKAELVARYIEQAAPDTVWDLGGNVGRYSRLAAERGIFTLSLDLDPAAVELNYRACRKDSVATLLPLVMDLSNPSPDLGWAHQERSSLQSRGPAGLLLALALVHHLAISNNTPLDRVAAYFASLGRQLVIEFVPKGDSQVERLLASREDIFDRYTQEEFERVFGEYFQVVERAGDSRLAAHAVLDAGQVETGALACPRSAPVAKGRICGGGTVCVPILTWPGLLAAGFLWLVLLRLGLTLAFVVASRGFGQAGGLPHGCPQWWRIGYAEGRCWGRPCSGPLKLANASLHSP